jgi:hypothetical protein
MLYKGGGLLLHVVECYLWEMESNAGLNVSLIIDKIFNRVILVFLIEFCVIFLCKHYFGCNLLDLL